MKVLACIVLALAVCAFAEEEGEKKEKRGILGLGYGAYPYSSYGAYPYGAYPYSTYGAYPYSATPYALAGSHLAYTAGVPAKTEVIPSKVTVAKTIPYTASSVLPYSTYGYWPYSSGVVPSTYTAGAYPYAGYPYNYGYGLGLGYGYAGKFIK